MKLALRGAIALNLIGQLLPAAVPHTISSVAAIPITDLRETLRSSIVSNSVLGTREGAAASIARRQPMDSALDDAVGGILKSVRQNAVFFACSGLVLGGLIIDRD